MPTTIAPRTGLASATTDHYGRRLARAAAWFTVAVAVSFAAWVLAALFRGATVPAAAAAGLLVLLVAGLVLVTASHRTSAYPRRPR